MNIADKGRFYREIHRVLKPGAWLVLSEIVKGEDGDLDYPTPWTGSAGPSFVSTPEQTRHGLLEARFDVIRLQSTVEKALAFGARSRTMVERGEKPPHRAVMLIHGEIAAHAIANTSRGLRDARIVRYRCRAPGDPVRCSRSGPHLLPFMMIVGVETEPP